MRRFVLAFVWLVVCLLTAAPIAIGGKGGNVIVDDGRVRAEIVVAPNADVQIRKAAGVLAEYVRKSTGATLPIVSESGEGERERIPIYIGVGALAAMDEQGFIIRSNADFISIVGPSVWGTLHGVYDFLERYVGVRWLLPGPDGEDVPQLSVIHVPWGEVKDEPAFSYRTVSPIRGSPEASGATQWHNEWAQRNRLQGSYNDHIRFHHNLHAVFPPAKYGKTHCQLYPNCRPPSPDQQTGWQPCFRADGSVEIAAAEIIAYFTARPTEKFFSLGVNDSRGHCEGNPAHPDYPGRMNSIGMIDLSDIYYAWVNDVVAKVLEVHPDKWFGLLAYYDVMDPPSFPLHPRVIPFVTKDRMAWIDEGIRDAGHRQMEAWNQVADQVAWYDYMYGGAHYIVPRIFSHIMAENLRYAKDHRVVGTYTEMYHTAIDGPKPWLAARLQWNPDQDVDELLGEWYVRAVGPAAAGDLAAFYDLWEHFWTERIKESPWFGWGKGQTYLPFTDQGYVHLVTDEDIRESKRLLAAVVAKAETVQQKNRAQLIEQSFAYCEASVLSYPRKMEPARDEDAALAMLDAMTEGLEERLAMAQRRYELVDEYRSNPLLRFQSERRIYAWAGWPAGQFFRVLQYLEGYEKTGGPLTERVKAVTAESSSRQVRALVELLLQIRDGAPSLTRESSFEDAAHTARWWKNWVVSAGSIRRVEDVAHTGRASMLIEGMERGGPHQTFEVQPGLAVVTARYYVPEGGREGTVQLTCHLKNAQGINIASYRSDRRELAATAGAWATLGILEEIPVMVAGEKVVTAQIVVTVDGAANTPVYVDDVSVCHSATILSASVYEQLVEFIGLPTGASAVGGVFDAQVVPGLIDRGNIEKVDISLNGMVVYQGTTLPRAGEVVIDTSTLQDGEHRLTASIDVKGLGVITKTAAFTVSNFWTMVDPFAPPMETAWFGDLDRSKTAWASEGWQYSEAQAEAFWGDGNRKLRRANTTEHLVWDTPALHECTVTLYAKSLDALEAVELSVSEDGRAWQTHPYTVQDMGVSPQGWRKLLLTVAIGGHRDILQLRLTLRQIAEHAEIQLGEAVFRGWR